jgi:hypothetical protein
LRRRRWRWRRGRRWRRLRWWRMWQLILDDQEVYHLIL